MRLHLSLTNKILLCVIVPLVLQLCILAALASMEQQAEEALKVASRSRQISDAITQISEDIFALTQRYRGLEALEKLPFNDEVGTILFNKIKSDYVRLKKVTRDQPEIYKAVIDSEEASQKSIEFFGRMQRRLQEGPISSAERRSLWSPMRSNANEYIFSRLIAIGREQKRLADVAPDTQTSYRQQMQAIMLGAAIFDLVLGAILALFLTREIATKVQRINENTYKLASGLPLHPTLGGTDEIARLDNVFHKMASELKESSRKQLAMVNNARDFICTIDAQGRFISANPASMSLLNIDADEILGKHFIDLVASHDVPKALNYLEELKTAAIDSPLELQMRSTSGAIVETIWSAHWSPEENSTFCVVHDMTERRRAEKLKQEVMAMITHDLRTPLSVINNVLSFFETGMSGSFDEKGRKYVLMAKRNADRMMSLINDLLDIEKIKSGQISLEIDKVKLSRCFESCEGVCAGLAEDSEVHLQFEKTAIYVEADEKRLDRVLSNLVSNAIKFSPKGKTVRVSAKAEEAAVIIRVLDEGPGIPVEMRESVFDRFQQVPGVNAGEKGGSGLGLTICREIVELHGGKIWVEGEPSNNSFVFSLPVSSNNN